ncbi:MAG: thioredoxin, thioredoxin 1 [candidate division WS6 bacterium GW2011_GWC1_33_20]|uniref:Thioredoxin n=1 Tax=candidate division WS6 bacterium GW2011_GWC1_33_20 TaxID=1619089 RepID=A0A0F9ZXP1_9BACT|nr:MAG: thioredoxin, thioredoxin 1 [candidate division WS6 bacterium GW2011_GWC1_33_20]OGC36212.1 MAG: thioredoxin [candidate division WS6 bacterium RIFOXYB1_FULL_33_15]
MSEIHLTDSTFKEEVLDYKGLALVDFWAPWCGPCMMLGPVIEELAEEMKDTVKVCKMNVDENMEFPQKYGIMSIPSILLFKDGELVETMIGLQPKESFISAIQKHS